MKQDDHTASGPHGAGASRSSSSGALSQAQFLGEPVRAILFDLDGTLVDTVGDIGQSLQRAFADHGLPPPTIEAVRTMIGRGAPILVDKAVKASGAALTAAQQQALLDTFFGHYGQLQNRGDGSATPFAGAIDGLAKLHAAGIPMAVVTNKQHDFAQALLARLQILPYVSLVVGGDTCERRKPDPQPLEHACTVLGVTPAQAVMVGDSVNDLTAARAASIRAIGVPYGYNEGMDPRELQCDAMVESIADLPSLLGIGAAPAAR